MNHIGNILKDSFKGLGLKERLSEYKVYKTWKEIVGAKIAEKTCPLRLKGDTLYVKVISSPWMQELSLLKDTVIENINKKLGEGRIKDIVFKSGIINKSHIRAKEEIPWKEISLSQEDEDALREKFFLLKDRELSSMILKIILKDKKLKYYLKETK